MRIGRRTAVAWLMMAPLAAAQARAARAAPGAEDDLLRRCVERRMAERAFSGIVSVARGGTNLLRIAAGRQAGPGSPPIGPGTRFNLASASKMFTAVAIAQLIDAGRLRLDDPVGRFIPQLAPEAAAVTVRQLLNHTSGLGDFFRPENMATMFGARTAGDLLPLVRDERPSFPPGSRFAYSNSGFALLGVLIERLSGMSYGEYLRRHVFGPAGMARTGPDPHPLATLAVGMTAGPGAAGGDGRRLTLIGPNGQPLAAPAGGALRPAPGATESYGSPAGGLFGTADDMQRFLAALAAHRLASAAVMSAFTAPQVQAAPAADGQPARFYGYGFGVGTTDGVRWYGHNGGAFGANSEVAAFPETGLSIVVLANRDPPAATDLFRWLRELVLHPERAAECGR